MFCLCAGCGAPAEPVPGSPVDITTSELATTAPPPYEPGAQLTQADMCVMLNGVTFPILSDIAPLLSALGEPDEYIASPSCVYEGEDKSFEYAAMGLYTNPDGALDILYEALLYDASASTLRGVRVGDARAAVEAAYGVPVQEGRYLCYYVGDSEDMAAPRILFEMTEEGLVKTIDIYCPTNITDG